MAADLTPSSAIHKWRRTFIISLLFAVPTIILAFIPSVPWPEVVPGVSVRDVVLFLMSTLVQVGVVSGGRGLSKGGCGFSFTHLPSLFVKYCRLENICEVFIIIANFDFSVSSHN